MRRLLVNDMLSAVPGQRTFWHDLQEWFKMEFIGGDYLHLAEDADTAALMKFIDDTDNGTAREQTVASLIVRNASYFVPLEASERTPTISLLQDIFEAGPAREMQDAVIASSARVVPNSAYTSSCYKQIHGTMQVIPLPVDFSLFEPQNAMGCQQALSLPDGCVCWIGACQGPAGHVKGWDILVQIARLNPDLKFVAVLKDALPDSFPPNMRCYVRLTHEELVKVIGACRIGLCTSRMESQHLAGIEMGACGLPLVAPEVGTYWKREGMPGLLVGAGDESALTFGSVVRAASSHAWDPQFCRWYWRKEFDRETVRGAWAKLIGDVECSGRS